MKHSIIVWVVALIAVVSGVAVAQNGTAPAEMPTLTDMEKSTLENKLLKLQAVVTQGSPEALAKAITDLIQHRQDAIQQAQKDAEAYLRTLQKPGYTLDLQTLMYRKQ